MGKLIFILIIIFLVAFIIQQSHLFETTRVMDVRLGVATDQYRVNWDNLFEYLNNIPKEVKKKFFPRRHRN